MSIKLRKVYCLASLGCAHRKHIEREDNMCYGFLQIADAKPRRSTESGLLRQFKCVSHVSCVL